MELRKILHEDDILIPMQADSKGEAIRQLAEMLKAHEVVMDMDAFMSDVFLREAEGVTGIGDYIAIPHGKSKGVKENRIAVGILQEPIYWESIDELPVKVVILFAVCVRKHDADQSHLSMMAAVAKSLAYDDVKQRLYEAESRQDVMEAILSRQ